MTDLFAQTARTTDPATSADAGLEHEISGTAQSQREWCRRVVIAEPGLTAREIEHETGIKAHKRLPELRRAGAIVNGRPRRCRVTGKRVLTWWERG